MARRLVLELLIASHRTASPQRPTIPVHWSLEVPVWGLGSAGPDRQERHAFTQTSGRKIRASDLRLSWLNQTVNQATRARGGRERAYSGRLGEVNGRALD